MRWKWSLAFAASLLLGLHGADADDAGIAVQIDSGPLLGKFQLNTAVRAFLGVPFAAPPVGELRWKPLADGAACDLLRRAMHARRALQDVGLLRICRRPAL
jgi:hypothetical protein